MANKDFELLLKMRADFAQALAHWCREEAESVRRYAATLAAHSPFRAAVAGIWRKKLAAKAAPTRA